ncbi:MAG: rod shape-determining protein MreD [Candidatus Omnitrophica bacterium]|nr:rod shape-determining protein MreD [Candidatus Omnitrophota bacterium]
MKAKKSLVLILVVLFTMLQCTVLNYLQVFKIKPDILLILVLFFSLYYGRFYALGVGVLCGLFAQATSGIGSGAVVFVYALGGLILAHLTSFIYKQNILSQMLISFIFTFLVYLSLFFTFHLLDIQPPLLNALFFVILPASFYTACIAPFLFYFLKMAFNIR